MNMMTPPLSGSTARPAGAPEQDGLGCTRQALGCDQSLGGPGFTLHRKRHQGGPRSQIETPASRRGLLVGVALAPGHKRRIFRGNRSTLFNFDEGACYVRSFSDAYRADVETGFDFFLLELSPAALDRTFAELELPDAEGLACTPGERDPLLAGLARALLPALDASRPGAPLLVEQVVCAMQTHLATRLHGKRPREARHLAPAQVARAREMLMAGIESTVLIADIADACGVSRSHFIRGFREATGATPHQWLMVQRVERAVALLAGSRLPLADIAARCGFSDQSHMTRMLARLTGATPGLWRRPH